MGNNSIRDIGDLAANGANKYVSNRITVQTLTIMDVVFLVQAVERYRVGRPALYAIRPTHSTKVRRDTAAEAVNVFRVQDAERRISAIETELDAITVRA